GRNLVLVDVSGSMSRPVSQRSAVDCKEIGALFGGAMALSSPNVDLVAFATANAIVRTGSLLDTVRAVTGANLGHSTEFFPALRDHYVNHDRVICFTDMQVFPDPEEGMRVTPLDGIKAPIYVWDLAGYGKTFLRP